VRLAIAISILCCAHLRPVQVTPDPLDNLSSADQQLWGIYATRSLRDFLPSLPNGMADFYYLGFFDAAATYNSGTGRELRHTIGSRFFGSKEVRGGTFDWNYEAILQFGSFDSQRGNGSILAWSVGTETGYAGDPLQPAILPTGKHHQRKRRCQRRQSANL
jgi:Alginate export